MLFARGDDRHGKIEEERTTNGAGDGCTEPATGAILLVGSLVVLRD
jgi:hypothetical protein